MSNDCMAAIANVLSIRFGRALALSNPFQLK
jgi:hypothetical protein